MKNLFYSAGRTCQLIGLITLPSAIWVGQIGRDERGAITIFLSSVLIFSVGYLLIHFSSRL